MKKVSIPVFSIISIIVLSIILLGFLSGYIYKSQKIPEIIISPNIIVKDSTSLEELKAYSSKDVIYLIEESIESNIYKEFEQTISILNWSIMLFSIFLTVMVVVFGLFTFRKINEAKDLLEKVKKAPNEVIKKYDEQILNENIPKLNSSVPIEKRKAIDMVTNNSQLDFNKHFDTISNVLKQEFQSISTFSRINVMYLFDSLLRLDYNKTMSLGFELLEKYDGEVLGMDFIIPHFGDVSLKEHKEKILSILCDINKSRQANILISDIEFIDVLKFDLILLIVEKAPKNIVIRLINSLKNSKRRNIDLSPIIKNIEDNLLDYQMFNQIINWDRQDNNLDTETIFSITKKVMKSSPLQPQVIQIVKQLIHKIGNIEELVRNLVTLREEFSESYNFVDIFLELSKDKNEKIQEVITKIDELD